MFPWSILSKKWFSRATASEAAENQSLPPDAKDVPKTPNESSSRSGMAVGQGDKPRAPKESQRPKSVRLSCIPKDVSQKELHCWLEGLTLPGLSDASVASTKDNKLGNVISLSMAQAGEEFQAIATLKVMPNSFTNMNRATNVFGPRESPLVVDDDFFGMTVIYAPEDTKSIDVDIITVPGFGGHALGSWRSSDPGCIWLRDFLPHDNPNIRVIIYGYDTNLKRKSDWKASTSELARNMLDSLNGIRDEESSGRPIIFLGHSLGGIIIKEAIVTSSAWQKSDERYQDVFQSCSSVIFFGVPHVGMRFKELEEMMQGMRGIKLASNLEIDDDDEGPEMLEWLNQSFGRFVEERRNFHIVCYTETERTIVGYEKEDHRPIRRLLVTKESARYPGKTLVPLDTMQLAGDHRSMIKFNTRIDEGYKSVARNIGRIIKNGEQVRRDANPPQPFLYGAPLPCVPNFVGREDELAKIVEASKILASNSSKTVVVRAMGGQGKTQLALAYCQSQRDKADIFWADSSSERSLKKDMAAAARLIDDSISIPDTEGLVNYTHQKLTNASRLWVMVFDNYDDPDLFSLLEHMPQSKYGLIIITTRHKDNDQLASKKYRIELQGLSDKHALILLSDESEISASTKEGDCGSDLGMKVVEKLGYHALAISQAGGIIKRRYKNFRSFLDLFEREKQKILNDKRLGTKHYFKKDKLNDQNTLLSVFTTLELSYQQLEAIDEEGNASDILTLLAFFDSRNVSEILLQECCSGYTPMITTQLETKVGSSNIQGAHYQTQTTPCPQPSAVTHDSQRPSSQYTPGIFLACHAGDWNSADYAELLDILASLSLVQSVKRADDGYYHVALHPVIRDWIRLRTEELARQAYSSLAATCIYLLLYATQWKDNRYVMPTSRKLEIAAHLDVCMENQQTFFKDSKHLPIYSIQATEIGTPELFFGRLTDDNGQDEKSEGWYRQSLKLRADNLGIDHSDTLTSWNDLGQALNCQSKYVAAEDIHRQTLERRQKVLGPKHRGTLTSMNNLAEALRGQKKHALAEETYRQTLKLRNEEFGPEDLDTLASMSGLASELAIRGNYIEAEEMYRRLLELRKKVSGLQNMDTLADTSNLASVLNRQGKDIEAEAKIRQILAIRKEILGLRHPDTLMSMNKLASVLSSQKNYEEAQPIHEETLKLRREILGPEHQDTRMSMSKLATVLSNQGKFKEAEEIRQQTLESMYSHARQLHKQGLYEDSLPLYQATYTGFQERYGEIHTKTVECQVQMESAKKRKLCS